MKTFFRYLLASSRFGNDSLDFVSLPLIRELVYRLFSITTPFALIPAVLVTWQKQQFTILLAQAALGIIVILHPYFLLRNNYRLLSPFMMFSVSIALYVLAVVRGEYYAIFFANAFTVAFYLLFERRGARYMSIASIVINGFLSTSVFPLEQSIYFIGSLITSSLMVEVLFSILIRHENYLQKQAIHDPLTNAYNRRRMMEDLDQALAMWDRYSEPPASIVMIDVDRFKTINDTYGHQEGDTVLVNLVKELSSRLRRTDKFYRYGGEEFLALLPGTPVHQAEHVAKLFCDQVRTHSLSSKTTTTISCGVAEATANETSSDWLARCDGALYRAKNNGRDCVEVAATAAAVAAPAAEN